MGDEPKSTCVSQNMAIFLVDLPLNVLRRDRPVSGSRVPGNPTPNNASGAALSTPPPFERSPPTPRLRFPSPCEPPRPRPCRGPRPRTPAALTRPCPVSSAAPTGRWGMAAAAPPPSRPHRRLAPRCVPKSFAPAPCHARTNLRTCGQGSDPLPFPFLFGGLICRSEFSVGISGTRSRPSSPHVDFHLPRFWSGRLPIWSGQ